MPVVRKAQWSWQTVAGSEENRLRAEQDLGSALALELRKKFGPTERPDDQALLARLGTELARHVRDQRLTFHFELLDLPEPAALALPGGFVFVGLSLVEFCLRYEDELAFVLGHEMSHVIRGHAADRMLEESALKVVSGLMRRAGPVATALVRPAGAQGVSLAYAEEEELEADELGSKLAEAAGHHPLAGVRLLERIQEQPASSAARGAYFASHPAPAMRIRHLGRVWRGQR